MILAEKNHAKSREKKKPTHPSGQIIMLTNLDFREIIPNKFSSFPNRPFFSEAHACRCHLKETCIDFTAQVGQGLRRTSWKQKSPSFSFEKNPWNGHGCRYWIASTQIEGYGDYFFVFSFKSPSYKVRPLVLRLALRWVENSWSKDNVAKHVWVS